MIQLIDLCKRFGDLAAVDSINLTVKPGEVFGFLGPNGAGKTTTIKMMAGLIKPTSGKVIIDGWDLTENPHRAKEVIGFILGLGIARPTRQFEIIFAIDHCLTRSEIIEIGLRTNTRIPRVKLRPETVISSPNVSIIDK